MCDETIIVIAMDDETVSLSACDRRSLSPVKGRWSRRTEGRTPARGYEAPDRRPVRALSPRHLCKAAQREAEVFGGRPGLKPARLANAHTPCKTAVRLCVRRPSDRRGSGSEPEPQCAFKVSMFSVSCNSH